MKVFVIIISCFNSFFIGISTIPTESCLTEDWFLCLNTFGWLSIFFYIQTRFNNHTLELKLKSLLLGRRLISLLLDHLIWLQKKIYTYTHVFILSLYQTEFSQVFYICMLLALEKEVYFSSTENSSLDGRKTLSLNTVENLQVSKFILKN